MPSPPGWRCASATRSSCPARRRWGRTRSAGNDRQGIAVSDGGLVSSAYQAAITKVGLLGNDRLRLTVAQPLHLERGAIDVASVEVVDRSTGALGTIVQTFDIEGRQRRYVAEMLYARTLMGGGAEMNLFGRANIHGEAERQSSLTIGSSFRIGF